MTGRGIGVSYVYANSRSPLEEGIAAMTDASSERAARYGRAENREYDSRALAPITLVNGTNATAICRAAGSSLYER
jgi:hypothetical protein